MESVSEERFVFEAEWFDQQADLIRKYLLTYYPKDSTIEMFDCKNKRMFLKRMAGTQLNEKELFVGSTVTVYARQLKLVDYGDVFTRQHFARGKQTSFALIKPDVYTHTGKIIDSIYQNGMVIGALKMTRFNQQTAARFLALSSGASPDNVNFLQSDVVTGLTLVGDDAIAKWNAMAGPADSVQAKMHAPKTIRAAFGTDAVKNAVHASSGAAQQKSE